MTRYKAYVLAETEKMETCQNDMTIGITTYRSPETGL